ncbi:malectin domain-containing carbohydrate-binding protein [Puia sp. P3]|uniref:malectin domain-containing carbohydrate-binding protein n=1 Tax=Puia sp. P3 TaxID=3423952 RepID=UPI003D666396
MISVRADHPAFIKDLPWVCGGCSDDRGFSEGSQPMGIFRPVHLVVTNETRVAPFGVHVWNDEQLRVYVETEVSGRGGVVVSRVLDRSGREVRRMETGIGVKQEMDGKGLRLWSLDDPYLYRLVTEVLLGGKVVDRVQTEFGVRVVKWSGSRLLLNGKPVFINGIAEYEHRLGGSHAFSGEEIRARVGQIRAAGFNAFRDAHQPHNLRYQHYWDSLGMLWWPQLSAHVWYDSPEFRRNFKQCLIEWIRERRNSPSIILWGLQNESKLPEDFARECVALIRELDPTSASQRKVTTCNGGAGTDWDVPQNWTGTYGGNPATYGADLKRQVLVGEYGGWRTLGLHGDLPNSEDRLDHLMELKIRLADSVADSVAGHFMWLYASHDNPGRVQSGEGLREIDRIGPVNYKGLMTSWEEPTDLYYLYRSNFGKGPMVYIVSHSWPDRWTGPGKKDGIEVYSNCDSVELYNDMEGSALGCRRSGGVGMHFQWDGVNIRYNVLYAVGYVRGKAVAKDVVVLHHLPRSPHFGALVGGSQLVAPAAGYKYLYRVNCGGGDYVDSRGSRWMADRHSDGKGWGSWSWTDAYAGMPAEFASQREAPCEPIGGTADWPLFQDFRYGLDRLGYSFPVQDGDYRVELYFAEPWLGRGGGLDCTGWRKFDVAVNSRVVLKDLDIWKEAGYCGALKKVVDVHVTGGRWRSAFPG